MKDEKRIRPAVTAIRIVLIYALVGGLWILFSDMFLLLVVHDPEKMARIAIMKGWLYVAVTALLLFFLIRQSFDSIKKYQAELKETEKRYRTIFESSGDALVIYDPADDATIQVNNAALKLFGPITAQEFASRKLWQLSPELQPDGSPSGKKAVDVAKYVGEEGCNLFEWRFLRKDGKTFDTRICLTRLVLGEKQYVLAAIRDVTALIEQETALRKSEENYRQLVDHAKAMIIRLDRAGNVTFFNEFAQKFFGFTSDEVIGRHVVGTIVPEEDTNGQDLRDMIARICADPDSYSVNENENVTKDGKRVFVRWSNRAVFDDKGAHVGLLTVGLDITGQKEAELERIEMERRLLHGQKLESLGVLAGGIAHDFNNLLTAILGNLDIAQKDQDFKAVNFHIEQAMKAALRAADLTHQMLAYSGHGSFHFREVDINSLVEDNASLLRATIPKNVTLRMNLGADVKSINADPGQIQQVVMNLITNAAEAIVGPQGVVTISTGLKECLGDCLAGSHSAEKAVPGLYCFIEVSDNGTGMEPATVRKIFDPFFTTKFTGRGLGMSAVLGIIRSHKGAIFIDTQLGRGTTITVLFPVSDAGLPKEGAKVLASATKPAQKLTVLLADDEDFVLSTVKSMLEILGYEVLTAKNGEEAIERYHENKERIKCVILDLTMPVKDGAATLKELKALRAKVPVIIASGYNAEDVLAMVGNHEGVDFLQKPYELSQLKAKIESVVPG